MNLCTTTGSLEDLDVLFSVQPIPQLASVDDDRHFFIPPLPLRPQDPILDLVQKRQGLDLSADIVHHTTHIADPELPQSPPVAHVDPQSHVQSTFWPYLSTDEHVTSGKLYSWDALRLPLNISHCSSEYLSEQDTQLYASLHLNSISGGKDVNRSVIRIGNTQLLASLRSNLLGLSTTLHSWNESAELFEPHEGNQLIFLASQDRVEVINQSLLSKFLSLSSLLRRLDVLVQTSPRRRLKSSATIHAFIYTLSNVVGFIRHSLTERQRTADLSQQSLSSTWSMWAEYEDIVLTLAELCGRNLDCHPSCYLDLPSDAVNLLSLIYDELHRHTSKSSSRMTCALLAHVLTVSSTQYIDRLSKTVALSGLGRVQLDSFHASASTAVSFGDFEGDQVGVHPLKAVDDDEIEDGRYPSFLPPELVAILPAATKSLKLLAAARPDHPILVNFQERPTVVWLWEVSIIHSAWVGELSGSSPSPENALDPDPTSRAPQQKYRTGLEGLGVFDLEPSIGSFSSLKGQTYARLEAFTQRYPDHLPSVTPTLHALSELVFSPLTVHSSSLSQALLLLLLDTQSSLSLQQHLVLLRSHMLFTSHHFRLRLTNALFSDRGDQEDLEHDPRSLVMLRGQKASDTAGNILWPVGLSPLLSNRESWPPGGAELSYVLRTVIVDSLEQAYLARNATTGGEISEIESRLGFAIRDLPVGPGRDNWLNPRSIEALDFLYLDYKVPHPLDVVITPESLLKYQRVFAFVLRLTRVEAAIRYTYRLTRNSQAPVFPTFSKSNKLLSHFRFVAHSFISNLSTYVMGTAIGANYDVFLRQLDLSSRSAEEAEKHGFRDVFMLADRHSALLDDILSACLLRSGQRAVGNLLRNGIEIVLEFTMLLNDMSCGSLKEYEATHQLEQLYGRFKSKMAQMTRGLRNLLNRDEGMLLQLQSRTSGSGPGLSQAPGGLEALHQLMTGLDLSDWWTHAEKLQSRSGTQKSDQNNGLHNKA
ncbi:hypothetical protein CONPUDRAFT_164016 [Coniophora puteana RWD-64-598 SS2]|uniref:Spindle pole body component n=1 Tax=Coniophora puteana (strain RWD-64-598) TaxID=741705 RepID=A0A5M3MV31_CONPW|nr:uncharacterized protein CONPUDRAFT_164016 [Coniophora puteana RWD-64-598 SS2]EIW82999.1 hypothetical protein CONPUDRAFT_164016 [Coniophora puteana RWD-64-598 SS2]